MRRIYKILLGIGLAALLMGGGWWLWHNRNEGLVLSTPWAGMWGGEEKKRERKVVGFLPTWMVGKTRVYSDEIDKLVFLGVEVKEDGDLVWDSQGKKINNEKYLEIKRKVAERGGKNILGIKLFEDNELDKLVDSPTAVDKLIDELKGVVIAGNFDGVNVDFEYQGDPVKVLKDDFYQMMERMKEAGLGEISLDVFANTVIRGDKAGLDRMLGLVDELIIMAYDFHRPGSGRAGAVAPIKAEIGERSIMEIVEKAVGGNLERKKIVLALPLYGYEWKTETEEYGAAVKGNWYQMASYRRMKEEVLPDLKDEGIEAGWNELSMSPWVVFREEGEIRQIYYEDLRSLGLKLDLIKESQLGGVGFWALGYEGMGNEVWRLVKGI